MHAPERGRLRIVTSPANGTESVVRLEGELDLATAASLRDAIDELDGRVVVDLSGVTFTDSTGLAALISARGRALQDGGSLRVQRATGQTRALLERTGMLAIFADVP